jgi:hypothetical protein
MAKTVNAQTGAVTIIKNKTGEVVCVVHANGNHYDKHGNYIGRVNPNGDIVNRRGKTVGNKNA